MAICDVKHLPGKELKVSSNYVSIDACLTDLKLAYSVSLNKYTTKTVEYGKVAFSGEKK